MLEGYSFLFYQLMLRLRDRRGGPAEDRWVSSTLSVFYVIEVAVLMQTIATIDIRINKAIVSAKKGGAPIDGCIFGGGAGTP